LEGHPLFELSQLLAYRRGQYDPSQHFEKVLNANTAPNLQRERQSLLKQIKDIQTFLPRD